MLFRSLMSVYTVRHWLFTMNRLFARTRAPYVDIVDATWPQVTVFIAAHNEEAVIAAAIRGLQNQTCPPDHIVVIADNCTVAANPTSVEL